MSCSKKYRRTKEIRADMKAEGIVRCLFIAARVFVHDWYQHDGSCNLSDYLVNYMELLLARFLPKMPNASQSAAPRNVGFYYSVNTQVSVLPLYFL